MVLYQSRSGNTEKVAKAIARAVGMKAYDVKTIYDVGNLQDGDLVFVGGAAYAGKCDSSIDDCFSKLSKTGKQLNIAIFATSTGPGKGIAAIKSAADAAGLKIIDDTFECRGKFLLSNRKRPDAEDLAKAAQFAKEIKAAHSN